MLTNSPIAAAAAIGLFVSMLLPWYTKTGIFLAKTGAKTAGGNFTAFGAFSFVEAAVLLVSVFVLGVLFSRAEGRAFHLPGGDGTIIMLAGAWAALLIFYRMLDKPGLHSSGVIYTEGITWGIFVALFVAIILAYAGWRMRMAARPEPPLLLPARGRRRGDSERPPVEVLDPDGGVIGTGAATAAGAEHDSPAEPRRPVRAPREPAGAEDDPTEPQTPRDPARPRYPEPPSPDRPPRRASPRAVTREDATQLSFDDPPVTEPFADDPPVARRRQ
jgi:hypothetical protein